MDAAVLGALPMAVPVSMASQSGGGGGFHGVARYHLPIGGGAANTATGGGTAGGSAAATEVAVGGVGGVTAATDTVGTSKLQPDEQTLRVSDVFQRMEALASVIGNDWGITQAGATLVHISAQPLPFFVIERH